MAKEKSEQGLKLACIKIAAEARSRIGMYHSAETVLEDAKNFHAWVTETTERGPEKDSSVNPDRPQTPSSAVVAKTILAKSAQKKHSKTG
jgi:hypothetical protein